MKIMRVFDRGEGRPIVVIPSLQGRWEYVRPALDALAESFRVVSFPLCGEPASGRPFDPARGLDGLSDQVAEVFAECRIDQAIVCGISFGGLVAVRFAAMHPGRTSGLVLVSTPGPEWRLTGRHRWYARAPWLFGPLFIAETPRRVRMELNAAIPRATDRRRFALRQVRTLVTAPLSLSCMAARARLIGCSDLRGDCSRIAVPTLVMTGESRLDRIVPVDSTAEYLRRIPGARAARLDRTGHLGYITRPALFAATIREFAAGALSRDDAA